MKQKTTKRCRETNYPAFCIAFRKEENNDVHAFAARLRCNQPSVACQHWLAFKEQGTLVSYAQHSAYIEAHKPHNKEGIEKLLKRAGWTESKDPELPYPKTVASFKDIEIFAEALLEAIKSYKSTL